MSVRVMSQVWQLDLPATLKLVLLRLGDHADDDGRNAYPSVGSLAEACSLTRRGVQKVLRDLEHRELIVLEGGGKGGRRLTRRYRITLKRANVVHPIKGERGSSFQPKRANQSAQKGERGSPEPSRTIRNRKYTFKGAVVRLTEEDLTRWQNTFINIPNLRALLESRDAWLAEQPADVQRKWFHSTAAWLANKDAQYAGGGGGDQDAGYWRDVEQGVIH